MDPDSRMQSRLMHLAAVLVLALVILGAYVRLADAGLSCPDWPGCYGQLTVAAAQRLEADRTFPGTPLEPAKARIEMAHRYLAAAAGLLAGTLALSAWWRHRGSADGALALALPPLLTVQALLGKWTVDHRLEPVVVNAHLLGGLAVLALLWWLALPGRESAQEAPNKLRPAALAALAVLTLQLALGGWTSANHADLACRGFPTCNGSWWPQADFATAFGGGPIDGPARVAIQLTHRLGALVSAMLLGGVALAAARSPRPPLRRTGRLLGLALLAQLGLGAALVLTGRPLTLAVLHTAGAALLLLVVLSLLHQLLRNDGARQGGRPWTVH